MTDLQEFSTRYSTRLPKSVCACGHTGDGANGAHIDSIQAGHGYCTALGCKCQKFGWAGFLLPYIKACRDAGFKVG